MDRLYAKHTNASPPAIPAGAESGYPQGGAVGQSPTQAGPYWFHMMTESARNVLVGAGLTPDATDLTLLFQAIKRMGRPAGMIVHAIWATPEPGWLRLNGQTISKAGAGGTARANDDVQDLFRILWSTHSNTVCPIQDSAGAASARGASWSDDWAAGKRLPLVDTRGAVLRDTDDGAGRDPSGRERGAYLADAVGSHNHMLPIGDASGTASIPYGWATGQPAADVEDFSASSAGDTRRMLTADAGAAETKAKDVAEAVFISY